MLNPFGNPTPIERRESALDTLRGAHANQHEVAMAIGYLASFDDQVAIRAVMRFAQTADGSEYLQAEAGEAIGLLFLRQAISEDQLLTLTPIAMQSALAIVAADRD